METSGRNAMENIDRYTRGLLLYRRGEYERAADQLAPLVERSDLLGRVAGFYGAMAHRAIGIEAMREGRFDLAEGHLRKAAGAVGGDADLTAYLSAIYAGTGRYDLCVREIAKIADSDDSKADDWCKLAQAQWRAGRRFEAQMTLTEALRRFDGESCLHVQIGLFCAAQEQFDEAVAHLARAVEADCTNADAHYYLGLSAAAQGDARKAVKCLQRALELHPGDIMLAHKLALAARAAGEGGYHVVVRLAEPSAGAQTNSQIRQLALYVAAEPDFVTAFLSLPDSEIDDDLFGMLVGVIQMALAECPGYADLNHLCSRVFDRLGRLDAAIDCAEKAIEINPQYTEAMVHLAKLYSKASRPAEAIECVELAIAGGADWPDVHCFAGELLGRDKKLTGARRHLERALQLNANYTRAAEALASLAA